jgi:hypothetical protein
MEGFAKPDSDFLHLPLSIILEASAFMGPQNMSIITIKLMNLHRENPAR